MSRLLRHIINPCDIDRAKVLAPLGDALHRVWAVFTYGTECTCCLGTRVIMLIAVTAAITATITALTP